MHMNNQKEYNSLITLVGDLNEKKAISLVRSLLSNGDNPLHIIENCQKGMELVGERYHTGQYFISGLIMAGEIFRQVMVLVQPELENNAYARVSGRMLLGTVQGDIHDIGKNIVIILLRCYGIHVIDLGVDVPAEKFISMAIEEKPRIIGISGVLTSSFDNMQETISLIRSDNSIDQQNTSIVIGGCSVDKRICDFVDADHWTTDALKGANICRKILANK